MRLLGVVRLVALVFMVVVSSSLHQQVISVGAIRLHDRRQHAEQWAEEREQVRSFMTMDYSGVRRRMPKHN